MIDLVHVRVKELLRFPPDIPDKEFLNEVKKMISRVCKPCWELKYCPYGPVVEEFPLMIPTRDEVEDCYPDLNPKEYPEEISNMSCNVFGHICPVFFVSEEYTETSEPRRRGRYIPFYVKVRVVRRDNYTCQLCGKHLKDNEVEFDRKIPVSKGGSSEEENVRLTCFKCNRDKRDRVKI